MGEEWVVKYKPNGSSEIQGQDKAVSELKAYIVNFAKGTKPVLLYGPPGTGKTSSVYAVASELNLEVVEVNASDVRNKNSMNDVLGSAIGQQSLFSKGKIILVDEVDGLSGTKDRGGIPELGRLMENSSFPVVMTANDPYENKFSKLRKKCKLVEFGNLNYLSVASKLKEVAKAEGIKTDEDTLKSLARRSAGDMRAAINYLQALTQGTKTLTKEDVDVIGDRERKETIFNALMRVFKTTQAEIARKAYDDVDADLDEIFLWMEENIPIEYSKPMDLSRAFDELSLANVFYGRIRKWQYYRFYVYCYDLLSAGIALAKDEKYSGFTKYRKSTKPLRIWISNNKLAKKKSIAAKVAEKTHTSQREAMQSTVPFLKVAFKNKTFAQDAIDFYDLDDVEVEWLRG